MPVEWGLKRKASAAAMQYVDRLTSSSVRTVFDAVAAATTTHHRYMNGPATTARAVSKALGRVPSDDERKRHLWRRLRVTITVVARFLMIAREVKTFGGRVRTDEEVARQVREKSNQQLPWYIIRSGTTFRSVWHAMMGVLIVYVAVTVPYRVCFLVEPQGAAAVIEHMVYAIFVADLIVNFFMVPMGVTPATMPTSHRQIVTMYLRSWFIIDFAASLPVDYILVTNESELNDLARVAKLPRVLRWVRLLRLLKTMRAAHLHKVMMSLERLMDVGPAVGRLLVTSFWALLITHFVACLWHFTSVDYDPDSWLVAAGIFYEPTWHRYIASLYFAFTTLTTVGFGDIHANNPREMLFCMFCQILGVAWYAFVVSTMTQLLGSIDRNAKRLNQLHQSLDAFFGKAKVPRELRRRITVYFDKRVAHSLDLFDTDMSKKILDSLSPVLRRQVLAAKYRRVIQDVPFIYARSIEFQAMCAPKMRAVYLEAREKLFVEGSAPDGMFFLVTGSIIFSRGGNALCSYRAGSYFGELSLMCFKERMFSAEAAQPTELYMLNAESIPDMLNSFPSVRLTLRDVARRRLEGFRQLCPDIPVARFFEHIVPGDLDTPAGDDTTVQGFPGSARDVDPTANPFMSDLERKLVPGKQFAMTAHSLLSKSNSGGIRLNGGTMEPRFSRSSSLGDHDRGVPSHLSILSEAGFSPSPRSPKSGTPQPLLAQAQAQRRPSALTVGTNSSDAALSVASIVVGADNALGFSGDGEARGRTLSGTTSARSGGSGASVPHPMQGLASPNTAASCPPSPTNSRPGSTGVDSAVLHELRAVSSRQQALEAAVLNIAASLSQLHSAMLRDHDSSLGGRAKTAGHRNGRGRM